MKLTKEGEEAAKNLASNSNFRKLVDALDYARQTYTKRVIYEDGDSNIDVLRGMVRGIDDVVKAVKKW